jgi:hypothetical protein
MHEHLESCGFEYLVSDDADVVIEALKAAGILYGGFPRITHQGLALLWQFCRPSEPVRIPESIFQ